MTATHHWLLEVDCPGLRLRYTSAPAAVVVNSVTYRPGLAPIEAAAGDDKIDVAITDGTVDWPRAASSITMVPCVLRRWRVGTSRAAVFAKGAVFGLQHGAIGETVAWTLLDSAADAIPPCPSPDAVIDSRTSPERDPQQPVRIPSSMVGERIPIVFGWPGYDAANTLGFDPSIVSNVFPVVPCPCWQVPESGSESAALGYTGAQIVISEDPRTTRPSQVRVSDGGENLDNTLTSTLVTLDKLGHARVVADFSGAGDDLYAYPHQDENGDISSSYLVGFSPAGDSNPTRDLFDVVTYLLERFGGKTVDHARVWALSDVLGGYNVDWFLNADCGPEGVWALLEDVFCSTLPFVVRRGTKGRYLQYISARPDPRRVVRELDVSRGGVRRAGGITYVGDNPYNEFVGSFGPWSTSSEDSAGALGPYFGTAVVGAVGDAFAGLTADLGSDQVLWDRTTAMSYQVCVTSQARYGRRVAPPIAIPWTWDRATAYRVLQARADREALPYRRVRYTVPEELGLEEDMHVRITDDALGLDTLAIVSGAPLVGGSSGSVVTLRIPGV